MMTPSSIHLRSTIRRSTLEKTADDLTFIAGLPTSFVYKVPFKKEQLSETLVVLMQSGLTVEESPKVLQMNPEIEVIGFPVDLFIARRSVARRKSTLDEVGVAEAE
jgi:hypothetical protein